MAVKRIEAVMVQVQAVGLEHPGEPFPDRTPRGAFAQAGQHHDQRVDRGHAEHQQRREGGQDGAGLERGGQRETRQDEPDRLGPAVAQEDPGGMPVERQEPEAGPANGRRDDEQRGGPEKAGEHRQAGGDDGRHAPRETVQAVHEIDGVGDADQPEDGRGVSGETERRERERRRGRAGADGQQRRDDLGGQLHAHGTATEVVHETDREDQRGRRAEHGGPRSVVRDREQPQDGPGEQTGEETARDGETARAGNRTVVSLAAVRVVDGPPPPAQTRRDRCDGG